MSTLQLAPGMGIRNQNSGDFCGTLGCIVYLPSGAPCLLTAGHVIGRQGYAEPGEVIEAFIDDGWHAVAKFERSGNMSDPAAPGGYCDAAIARIDTGVEISAFIPSIGRPAGISNGVTAGQSLQLFGAMTSEHVAAIVQSTGNAQSVVYSDLVDQHTFSVMFDDLILYGCCDVNGTWIPCTAEADSGALVLDDGNLAVGLHIAVTPPECQVRASMCTPISSVLNSLGVSLNPPIAQSAPTAALNARDAIGASSFNAFGVSIRSQLDLHPQGNRIQWQLCRDGLVVDGQMDRTAGQPITVHRVWSNYETAIRSAAIQWKVPVELVIATICTESQGNATACRLELNWISDDETPRQVSPGLMQTLLSTARSMLGNAALSRSDLFNPAISINAGTAFIANQRHLTLFDPPLVACAYNEGSLVPVDESGNRWCLRQTTGHADRFVQWFNDCFAYFDLSAPDFSDGTPSLFALFR